MKKSRVLVASMAAATATAISASSSDLHVSSNTQPCCEETVSSNDRDHSASRSPPSTDKFAPRFDGLRFIETLVTAHK